MSMTDGVTVDFQGNPLEWRAMWKNLVEHPLVNPHVYYKK